VRLREILGTKLLTVMTGADESAIDAWATGTDEMSLSIESRLRTIWEAVALLLEVEDPSVIRAWFAGSNFLLGNRAPAAVARENPHATMNAAIEFRAYG
jgi:hypothetical protein